MSNQSMNMLLWVGQSLLAMSLAWASGMKFFKSRSQLKKIWSWTGELPVSFVIVTGWLDLAGALGLILPGIVNHFHILTIMAAFGIAGLMVCAAVFHLLRHEGKKIGINIAFAILALFIAWGRLLTK